MPNINTSSIEGFEGMTAEQKVEALLKLEIPEAVDMSKFISKELFDKKASEAANLSKQLREKQTDDEAAKAEQEAHSKHSRENHFEQTFPENKKPRMLRGFF